MKYLGLDYGSKTLGLAISDSIGLIASALIVLKYDNEDKLLESLDQVIKENDIECLVLGYPLSMSGKPSPRTEETLRFKSVLEGIYNMPIYLQDERLSSVEVNKMLINNNTSRKKRKQVVDKLAATIILQSFLDKKGRQ